MNHRRRIFTAVVALGLVLAACGGETGSPSASGGEPSGSEAPAGGGTLIFGSAADPAVIDGALVSDGESLRVVQQVFESLMKIKVGTTEVEPNLATSATPNEDGTEWTFELQQGVTFHDGTPFNADAVKANFDRWFGFTGDLQSESLSYYWLTVFGNYADPGEGMLGPDEGLFKEARVDDEFTITIVLNQPNSAFLSAMALPSFSIASPAALEEFGADDVELTEEGSIVVNGTFGTEHPIGTGPFTFVEWVPGDHITLERNDDYWGEPAILDELIIRPISDPTARLQALQSGDIDGMDFVNPAQFEDVRGDTNLQLLEREPFNVGYIGFNASTPPFDKLEVRQAVAHAIDKQAIADAFYGGAGEPAKEFMIPTMWGYNDAVEDYAFDPEESMRLLGEAGCGPPCPIDFWYPTEVTRSYMPDPKANFDAMVTMLEDAGFEVTPHSSIWGTEYIPARGLGQLPMYLLGWIGDFGDPDNWVGTFFRQPLPGWGTDKNDFMAEVQDILTQAVEESDQTARQTLYEEANQKIHDLVPGVPYVHAASALAFKATVTGYNTNPTQTEFFSTVSITE
jgi:peptide/nickel transport system substrate-binding protein